jgi:MFS family permease
MDEPAAQAGSAGKGPPSALAPFNIPAFRMLWSTWMIANLCMWMNDVAAAWLMTSMTTSPIWVALVQAASTLPVFLLGLPSGAMADIVDRRRYLIVTQFWGAAVALVLCLTILYGTLSPPLLLALVLANGVGLAMRWPVYSALIPALVPRHQLPAALGLNGIAMNASRIFGPLVAGTLIASVGSRYVFMLNAVLSVISGIILIRWRREHVPSPLGRERLLGAMRVGVQFVRQSSRLRGILLRVALFFFHSAALMALLPLVARGLHGGDAGTFTVLLASMGAGAIIAVLLLPRLRLLIFGDRLVLTGTAVQAAVTVTMAFAPNLYVGVPAMLLAGMVWITTVNSLSVRAQMALPDWVRARGMSIYQMAIMGGSALGAGVWGQIATLSSVPVALMCAAASGIVVMLVAQRLVPDHGIEEDLTPSREFKAPVADVAPGAGRVHLSIEYRIDPANAVPFRELMQESRRSRLRQGALSWELLRDISDPTRYVEQIVDESWTEHLRRFDRVTAADVALRDQKLAYHTGDLPPAITRCIVDPHPGT